MVKMPGGAPSQNLKNELESQNRGRDGKFRTSHKFRMFFDIITNSKEGATLVKLRYNAV
ncbi:MAG: hypothetical protein ACI959_001416 [Limisphaerales bacterium]|jgi:hypothetical protein